MAALPSTLRLASIAVALVGLAAPTKASEPLAVRSGGRMAASAPVVRFRFHAGAPLRAPAAVGADGAVYVGAEDGYLHALHADGSYAWSISLHGAVARAPLPVAERVFVATTTDRVYAVNLDGSLVWVFVAPAGIESELTAASNGLVYFLGRDHHLYGLTAHGSVALRLPTGDVSAGPVVGDDGEVWLGSPQGELSSPRLAGAVRVRLGAPVRAGLSVHGALYWLAGQELVRATASGAAAYRFSGIARTAGPASVTTRGDCLWLADDGRAIARLSPCASPGARPSLGPQQELLLPTDDGVLVVATPRGLTRVALATSRLLSPLWSPASSQVIASAREGPVCGVELPPPR